MQSDVAVGTNAITGTLAFIQGGLSPAGYLSGDGHFLALKFSTADWADFDRVEVGLDPSQGSGLVDVLPDPDKNGVFKITSTSQKFIVKTTAGEDVVTKEYSLAGLVLSPEPEANLEARFRLAVDGGQTSVNIATEDNVTTYSGSFDGDYSNEGMMIRVQHDDADKPFTLVSYTINDTPITLTQGETGDYSAFLTGPNVPDPTDGYDVEIVLELEGIQYTYTLDLSYIAPTPAVNPDAYFTVAFSGPGATGFMQETEAGVTSYSGTFSGDPSTLPLQLTVAHMDPDKDFTLTSYKINDESVTLSPDGDGDYVATLTGSDIPDPTNGYNIEVVIELDNVSYTYEITLTYSGT